VDGEQWAARFSPGEFDKSAWLEAYVVTMGDLRPEVTPSEAMGAALRAYEREGWGNPKVAAGLDALLGPGS